MEKSKTALVTGSGKKRVGFHVAAALADRGWNIAVHFRSSKSDAEDTVKQLGASGIQAEAFQADLSGENEVSELVQRVLQRFGGIDALVHCAAVWPRKSLEETRAEDVHRCFSINTLSTFLCVQQAGLAMVKQERGGCIVTFGDWAVARPYRDHAAYFVSKGAIPTLTRTLAVELAARNPQVRVNCIQPGPVMLPDDLPDEERQQAVNATLAKREGNPRNISQAVLYLIDNDFVTGSCLTVDGGRTVYGGD